MQPPAMRLTFATLSVCECCLLMAANGECCADAEHGGDGKEPLSLATGHVVPGTEALGFSWGTCEGCGSTLAGDRYQAFAEDTA